MLQRTSRPAALFSTALFFVLGPDPAALAETPSTITEATRQSCEPRCAADRSASRAARPSSAHSESQPRRVAVPVVYQPPLRGAPRARIGGGVRRMISVVPTPLALAPEHVADTLSASPSLYWHIDGTVGPEHEIVFTLIEVDGIDPIVEKVLEAPSRSGIQRVDVVEFGVELERGVEYEWSVSVGFVGSYAPVAVSTAFIRLADPLSSGAPRSVRDFASRGLWYDALATAQRGVEASPRDHGLRHDRESLLSQAGLERALR